MPPTLRACAWHQTDVRVANRALLRTDVAQQLNALADNGCWVDIVYSNVSDGVKAALSASKNLRIWAGRPMTSTCDEYLHNFWSVRDTCRAKGGAVR